MDGMVANGEYRDYSELFAVSVANQFLLHSSQQPRPDPLSANSSRSIAELAAPEIQTPRAGPSLKSAMAIPDLFLLNTEVAAKVELAAVPSDVFLPGMDVPADRWIFGQHNKLLPVKANVRALLNLIRRSGNPQSVELDEASREIAGVAATLGTALRAFDEQTSRPRDEAMALAFPSSDASNSDKSRLRYASQFVGSVSKDGKMTGLLIDLKLVNIDRHKPPRIGLTEPGLRLAEMPSPILDHMDILPTEKFSHEELDFLIQHVSHHLPVEEFAFSVTLDAISRGHATPERLDLALKKYLPDRKDKPFTDAFLTTQRAGVISRMADLALVSRTRSGPNVTYVLTDRGTKFLKRGL
jgi:hypothetical protein